MEPLRHGDPERVRDYRLLARLGAGGMGVVYLGLSPAGRAVAVKVIRPRLAGYDAYGEIRAYVAATGAPLWTHPIGRRTGEPDVYSNVDKSSIALAGDTLYALSNEGWRLYPAG